MMTINGKPQPAAGPRIRGGVLIAVLSMGAGAYAILQSLVSPALATIGHDLHASAADTGWVLTGYLLAAAVATPIAGKLGDLYGKRKILLAVLALLAIGCLVAALATSLSVLIIARVIQGAAGALFPLSFGIVRDEMPKERVSTSIGLLSAILGIGGGVGIVLAGPIVQFLNWHWLFWFPFAVTVLSLAGAWLWVPKSPSRVAGGLSVLPPLLLTGWLVTGLLALSKGSAWGWTSPSVLGLLGAAVLLAVWWVIAETRAKNPLVDMRILKQRAVWATDLSALAIGFAMFGAFILIPQLLVLPTATGYGFGKSVTIAGLFLLPPAGMMLAFGPVSGALTNRVGSRFPIVLGALVTAVSFAIPALGHAHTWELLACTFGFGIGMGLSFAALANALVEHVSPEQTGVATGVNTLARSVGGSIGSALVAAMLTGTVATHGLPTDGGFTKGFWLCTAAALVAAAAGFLIPRHRKTTESPAHLTPEEIDAGLEGGWVA
jgi:EmrB/QacA subfamily drug resistance transporter